MDSIAKERGKLVDDLPIDRKELARRAKCSPGTLSDWINDRRPVREHLHDAIMRAITESRPSSEREVGASQSVSSGLALREAPRDLHTLAQCKQRIAELESEVTRLWAMIEASRPRGLGYGQGRVSSGPTSEEAALLDAVEKHSGGGARS